MRASRNTGMGAQTAAQTAAQPVAPEDDPKSELNVLRREVRQLQAAVRDAGLQVASQQEELISLRTSLAVAENDVEEGLAREVRLRSQLDVQRLKKQRIESTMAAAETLVSSLRDMILEGDAISPSHAPEPPLETTQSSSRRDDLDSLLSRISERGVHNRTDAPVRRAAPQPALEEITRTVAREEEERSTQYVPPRGSDLTDDHVIGNTDSSTKSPIVAGNSVADDGQKRDVAPPPALYNVSGSDIRKRHSLPTARNLQHSGSQVRPAPASNLLLSAFGQEKASGAHKVQAVRSSSARSHDGVRSEIDTLAKGDDAMRRGTAVLPSCIRGAVSDAHSGELYSLVSSGDGKWIASAGDDKLVKIYDHTGAVYGSISECSRGITALAFGPQVALQGADMSCIYAGSMDGSVRSFRKHAKRRAKWTLGWVYPVHSQVVRKILFTDSHGISGYGADMILSCSTDRTIKLCDVESGQRAFVATTPSSVLDVDTFGTNGGGMIVSGHKDGGVRLWSPMSSAVNVAGTRIHSKGVVSLACLEDGHTVVTLGRDNAMRVCDTRKGVSVVRELDAGVECASDWHRLGARGRFVGCGLGRSGQLGVWNVDSGKMVRRVSSRMADDRADVLKLVARQVLSAGCIVVPHWTSVGQFVSAHRTRQVSFWDSA